MTSDEMERTIHFILAQQAQFSANMGQVQENISQLTAAQTGLAASQRRTDEAVQHLTVQVLRTDEAVERLTVQVEQMARQQSHINEVVAVIAEAQQHTDERLGALIDIVREGHNGQT